MEIKKAKEKENVEKKNTFIMARWVKTDDIIAAFVLETTLHSPPSALLAAGYIPPQTKPNTEVPKMI